MSAAASIAKISKSKSFDLRTEPYIEQKILYQHKHDKD